MLKSEILLKSESQQKKIKANEAATAAQRQ